MKRIYKYTLDVTQRQLLQVPEGHKWLSVGVENSFPVLFAEVDPDTTNRTIIIRGVTTGDRFNGDGLEFIGTVRIEDWFVFHIYEQQEGAGPDPLRPYNADDWNEVKQEVGTPPLDEPAQRAIPVPTFI